MSLKSVKIKEVIAVSVFIVIFVVVSVFSFEFGDSIRELIRSGGILSVIIYTLFLIVGEVVAPVSSLPVLPIAVSAWGSFWAALITLSGWLIGAMIAFSLARKFGQPLVSRIINLERIKSLSHFVPQSNFFWIIVFLRIIFPVDIFSYTLGLFTNISWRTYFFATLLGVTPFSFIFAYGVRLNTEYQLIIGSVILLITILFYHRARQKISSWIKSGIKQITD
jgi:uncharacterized membrane protein YdjX (TVP38/TMEM64 family)